MALTQLHAQSLVNKAIHTFLNSDLYLNSEESRVYRMKEKVVAGNINLYLKLSSRMKSTAGRAAYNKKNGKVGIVLNRPLLSLQSEEEIYSTVSHEVSHCLHYLIEGKMNHKWLWQKIDLACGGNGVRCHDYDVSKVVRRHYVRDKLNNKMLMMATCSANRVKRNPHWYGNQYEYVGIVDPNKPSLLTSL
jgi:predicted SprT family Zn-dependent metalloprotease